MAYRLNNTPPPKPENTLPRFIVRNGTIVTYAFPCFYLPVIVAHDSHYHDYIGWPAPNYPGQACQHIHGIPLYRHANEYEHIDFMHPEPIDLLSEYEGYTGVEILRDKNINGLTMQAWFDRNEPNVIYLGIQAELDFFEDKPISERFTLVLTKPDDESDSNPFVGRDVVIRGIVDVHPGNSSEI